MVLEESNCALEQKDCEALRQDDKEASLYTLTLMDLGLTILAASLLVRGIIRIIDWFLRPMYNKYLTEYGGRWRAKNDRLSCILYQERKVFIEGCACPSSGGLRTVIAALARRRRKHYLNFRAIWSSRSSPSSKSSPASIVIVFTDRGAGCPMLHSKTLQDEITAKFEATIVYW